jgi:hypothetical protein
MLALVDEAYAPFGRYDDRPLQVIEDQLMRFDEFKAAWVAAKFSQALEG